MKSSKRFPKIPHHLSAFVAAFVLSAQTAHADPAMVRQSPSTETHARNPARVTSGVILAVPSVLFIATGAVLLSRPTTGGSPAGALNADAVYQGLGGLSLVLGLGGGVVSTWMILSGSKQVPDPTTAHVDVRFTGTGASLLGTF